MQVFLCKAPMSLFPPPNTLIVKSWRKAYEKMEEYKKKWGELTHLSFIRSTFPRILKEREFDPKTPHGSTPREP